MKLLQRKPEAERRVCYTKYIAANPFTSELTRELMRVGLLGRGMTKMQVHVTLGPPLHKAKRRWTYKDVTVHFNAEGTVTTWGDE